jgi:hypothetical protein
LISDQLIWYDDERTAASHRIDRFTGNLSTPANDTQFLVSEEAGVCTPFESSEVLELHNQWVEEWNSILI